jgi:hypothetical protein
MNNIVNQLKLLRKALDAEEVLREATQNEFNNGITDGPMRQAHDAAIQSVINAAQQLIDQK